MEEEEGPPPPNIVEIKMGDEGEGETLHLLHPDGTVTVQFISTDENGGTYITNADGQHQFITTDDAGGYLTTGAATSGQYILAIDSDGQIIASGPPEQFITPDSEDVYEEGEEVADMEGELDEDEEIADMEDEEIADMEDELEEGEVITMEDELDEEEIANMEHELEEVEEIANLEAELEEEEIANLEDELEGEEIANMEDELEREEISNMVGEPEMGEIANLENELEQEVGGVSNLTVALVEGVEPVPAVTVPEVLNEEESATATAPAVRTHSHQLDDSGQGQHQGPIPDREEQERKHCANCFCKLIFQRGKSRKFTDKLHPHKDAPESSTLQKKHVGKEVTLLEAMDLLFDLGEKSKSSSIRLCKDYVLCFKCVSLLSKVHALFVEFTQVSKSPSFMKSIFRQYGVLNEFSEVIKGIKQERNIPPEPEIPSEEMAENISEDHMVESGAVNNVTPAPPPSTPLPVVTKKKRTEKSTEKERKSTEKELRKIKMKIETPTISECSRLPRSCKKRQNYRALDKGRQHDSDSDDEDGDDVNSEQDPDAVPQESPDENEILDNMPLKKRMDKVENLKSRIKEITEIPVTPIPVKRKRGRPRKNPLPAAAVSPILQVKLERLTDVPRSTKKHKSQKDDDQSVTSADDKVIGGDNEESEPRTSLTRVKIEVNGVVLEDEGVEPAAEVAGDAESDGKEIGSSPRQPLRKSIQCSKCCARFIKQSHYSDHLRVHSGSGSSVPCTHCHGTFNTLRNLSRHITLNHTPKPKKKVDLPRPFTCPECQVTFTRLFHLRGHLVNQHQVDPEKFLGEFPCPVCQKKHSTELDLKAHLDRKHLVRIKERKNKCEDCGRRFLKKSDLENHSTTHTNIRRFMCDVCGFCSKRPQDLTRHRKLVHLKETKHTCSTCGKGFLSLWQMKSHQLSHDEYKGFPCREPGCGKSFRCPNNLRQHTHVHQGVKHVCQYCGESYSRTAYLARHIKINHLGMELPPIRPKKQQVRSADAESPQLILRSPKIKKMRRTYEILDNNIEILQPEPLELDIDIPTEDGHTQQVILHGFDDRYEGVIMEYIIG